MCFLNKIANETMEKFYLPLQTLDINNVCWGRQGQYSSNIQWIDLDAILRNHKAKKKSRLNSKNTFVWIELYVIMTKSHENVPKMPKVVFSLL